MATSTFPGELAHNQRESAVQNRTGIWSVIAMVIAPIASLKLTVFLFAASIFLIFFGTLAQVEKDMWEVMGQYFFTWVAMVDIRIFFPRAWVPGLPGLHNLPGRFPFPGGMMIGVTLFANLIAAHAVRFKIQARGQRLFGGLLVIAVGVVLTTLIIVSGHNRDGLQGAPPFSWRTLWLIVKLALVPLWLVLIGFGIRFVSANSGRKLEAWLLGIGDGVGTLLVTWIWFGGESSYIGDSGMRILWQLMLGLLAAGSLLIGCLMVFKKRGGIVLIHGGVGLLMFGQLFVNIYDKEEQITLVEKEKVNFARDIRSVELAIVDPSGSQSETVIAVPLTLKGQMTPNLSQPIRDGKLPFDIQVDKYLKNSGLRAAEPDDNNPATVGEGRFIMAEERRGASGASSGNEVDMAAAYVTFSKKGDATKLGTHLLAQEADIPEQVTIDGKQYDVYMRFARSYKPYSIELTDVRKDDYLGTDTPKNYSSDVRLVDPDRNVDTAAHIWMNNPLRYSGETFYQSGYKQLEDGSEVTTLQVVRNSGWMIPYVACMLVVVGLKAHFSLTLLQFLTRVTSKTNADPNDSSRDLNQKSPERTPGKRGQKPDRQAVPITVDHANETGAKRWIIPAAVLFLFGLWAGSKLIPRTAPETEFDLAAFGRLPVVYQGRAKPFDTLARSSLRMISDNETFRDENNKAQPAIGWLLDVISGAPDAEKHKVFRIPSLEVLDLLGLERRIGYRYSLGELRPGIEEFERQVRLAKERQHEKGAEFLDIRQKKVLELDERVRVFTMLLGAFRPPELPDLPTAEEFNEDRNLAHQKLDEFRRVAAETLKQIDSIKPPLSVPVRALDENGKVAGGVEWQSYARAWTLAYVQAKVLQQQPEPATAAVNSILFSYRNGDTKTFNLEVNKYRESLERHTPPETKLSKIDFEAAFNRVSPFALCKIFYLCMFVLSSFGLLGWVIGFSKPFNRAAFWLGVLALTIHTFALVARIYISGRPPVTNLYSSAVYIGWACVVLGLIMEAIFRLGIGNLVASILGFASLVIAQYLSNDGDTFTVLQAVLDTQFWLATHVVCISTGYATTFMAGLLGICYVLGGIFSPALSKQWYDWRIGKLLSTMIYGVVCFSLVFSFTGTVLGGLWADDSWGRFWGWDPKENGALIIVIWNALVLHARWGGMVRERGLAVLAVGGNIVTGWSWFGVNELGVGLHSYGFTEGVLYTLMVFVSTQLLIIALGACIPKSAWLSFRSDPNLA